MGFGDILDKVSKASGKASEMASKVDQFKGMVNSYNQLKQQPSLATFTLVAGGDSKAITSGIPSLDLEAAEEEGGLFDTVKSGISDLVGSEFEEAFEAGVEAAGGVAQVMETAGGLADNFSSLGDAMGNIAGGMQSAQSAVKAALGEKRDLMKQITNMRDMFGFAGSEVFGNPRAMTESRIGQLAEQFKMVNEVVSVATDISKGKPAISDFINGKYPTLSENMPDVVGQVSENIGTITDPISTTVDTLGGSISNVVTSTTGVKDMFGNVVDAVQVMGNPMGNDTSETAGFLEKAMSKVNSTVTSATVGLQKDLFGNFPDVGQAVDYVLPTIGNQINSGIPNIPSPSKVTDTLIAYGTEFANEIENTVVWDAVDAIIDVIPDALPTDPIPIYDDFTGEIIGYDPSIRDQYVMGASDSLTKTLNSVGKTLTSVDVGDAVEGAISTMNDYLGNLIPDLPSVSKTVESSILDMDIPGVSTDLTNAIIGAAGSSVMGSYQDAFEAEAGKAVMSVLNGDLPGLPDFGSTSEFIDSVLPKINSQISSAIPNFPTGDSIRNAVDGAINSTLNTFMGGLPLTNISSDITGVADTLTNLSSGITGVLDTHTNIVDTGFNALSSNFSKVTDITGSINSTIANVIPDISSSLNSVLPNVQQALPDVTGYLNDTAPELMNAFRNNLPAIPAGAGEHIGNMVNFASNLADLNAGKLTDAAKSMLNNVNIPAIQIPNISNLQMGAAVQGVFRNIEKIQSAQFALDSMEKAKEMIPNLEGITSAFEGWSWEGTGMSLGDIPNYFSDISSSEEMLAEVTGQLEGAPPMASAIPKAMGALSQANAAKAQVQGKIAEAEANIAAIESAAKAAADAIGGLFS